jgi:hypothetical protein
VIRVCVGVHELADAFALEPALQCRNQLVGHLRRTAVHQQDAVVADLRRDVHVAEVDHVDLALHREDADLDAARGRWPRRLRAVLSRLRRPLHGQARGRGHDATHQGQVDRVTESAHRSLPPHARVRLTE